MKSQMTIEKQLFLSFGAALTLAVSGLAFQGFGTLGGAVEKLIKVNARKQYLAGDMDASMASVIAWERGILLRAYMKDRETMEKYNQGFRETSSRVKKDLDEFVPLVETAEARQMAGEIQSALGRRKRARDRLADQSAGVRRHHHRRDLQRALAN